MISKVWIYSSDENSVCICASIDNFDVGQPQTADAIEGFSGKLYNYIVHCTNFLFYYVWHVHMLLGYPNNSDVVTISNSIPLTTGDECLSLIHI